MVRSGSDAGGGAVAAVSAGTVLAGVAATVGETMVVVVVEVVVGDDGGAAVLVAAVVVDGATVLEVTTTGSEVEGAVLAVDPSGSGTVDGMEDPTGSSLLAESVTRIASRLARITISAKQAMRLVPERPVGVGVVDVVMVGTRSAD